MVPMLMAIVQLRPVVIDISMLLKLHHSIHDMSGLHPIIGMQQN